ncbi:gliding motility-associated C-terminal domain-containing protein [Larkinella sp. VNQ87]
MEVLDATAPNFRAYSCADMKVVVDIVNDAVASQYDEFIVDWNDGSPLQTVPKTALANITHTYQTKRTYTLKVSGNYRGLNCGGGSFQQVTPNLSTDLVKPVITRLATSGSTVTLQVQAGANQSVTLYQKGASGTFTATAVTRVGNGSLVIANITAHPTCFKVVSQDACGQLFESDEVCSIGLEVEAREKQNEVVWTAPGNPANFRQYSVTKNDAAFRTINSVGTTSVSDAAALTCNEEYCYQVTAQAGPTEIVSDRVCVTAQSSAVPPPFSTVQVSVNGDNRVDLRGLPPVPTSTSPRYKMLVFRADPSGGFGQTGEEIDRNIHQDGGVQPQQQSYCYQVVYQNACGVSSEPSKTVCTIHLGSNWSGTIDWTAGSPFADEAIDRYIVEKIDESGVVWEEVSVGTRTSYQPAQNDPDNQRFRFRVKAISKSGAVSYSNFYTFLQAARLFVPDAFTPNGDGINDLLEIKGSTYFDTVQLTIYNRWGEVVFRTESREGWDGTIGGQAAQPGSYTYRILAQDPNGVKTEKRGSVLLIK